LFAIWLVLHLYTLRIALIYLLELTADLDVNLANGLIRWLMILTNTKGCPFNF